MPVTSVLRTRAPTETPRRAAAEDLVDAFDLRKDMLWLVGAHARNEAPSIEPLRYRSPREPRQLVDNVERRREQHRLGKVELDDARAIEEQRDERDVVSPLLGSPDLVDTVPRERIKLFDFADIIFGSIRWN